MRSTMSKLTSTEIFDKKQEFNRMFKVKYGHMVHKDVINVHKPGIWYNSNSHIILIFSGKSTILANVKWHNSMLMAVMAIMAIMAAGKELLIAFIIKINHGGCIAKKE
jgi:hypothetical protein